MPASQKGGKGKWVLIGFGVLIAMAVCANFVSSASTTSSKPVAETKQSNPTTAPTSAPTQLRTPTVAPTILPAQPFNFAQANLKVVGPDTADILGTTSPGATLAATWGTDSKTGATADGNGKYDLRITGLPLGATVVTVIVAGDASHQASAPAKTTITRIPAPIVVEGQGSKITPPFNLPQGNYRLQWTAQGHDNLIVTLHAGTSKQGLINEIPPDPSSGEVLVQSDGVDAFLEVQAPTLAWHFSFINLLSDDPNTAAPPITLQGTGSKVTAPITLPAGNYRVSWTAQGHDNLIVTVLWASGSRGIINEIPPDPASGEVLFESGGGTHVLEVKASTLAWTITFTKL